MCVARQSHGLTVPAKRKRCAVARIVNLNAGAKGFRASSSRFLLGKLLTGGALLLTPLTWGWLNQASFLSTDSQRWRFHALLREAFHFLPVTRPC
jgi:hypothetical protein